MCKVYTDYCGTSEIEHGLCACTVDNLLAKARGLSLRKGAQTMLYLSHNEKETVNWVTILDFMPYPFSQRLISQSQSSFETTDTVQQITNFQIF